MSYERAEGQLLQLSSRLLAAAEQDEWDQVSKLHGDLQGQLHALFSGAELPADHRPAQLISEIQRVSENLAVQAELARTSVGLQLDQARHRRQGMALYQETANNAAG